MFVDSRQRSGWGWWMVLGALLWGAGCRGTAEEVKREAPPPPAPDAAVGVVPREPSRRNDMGASVCPARQYMCCDGSCSEDKGCPGIACDPRPKLPEVRE
ncbi:hypothetical protein WA016_00349 [Myxococcus stipitatus]